AVPEGFNPEDAIGVDVDRGANDVAMFFRNGSHATDGSQADFSTNISFDSVFVSTYNSGSITGNNITETTNITLQTRVSNDSVTFTDWSLVYIDYGGTQTITGGNGRYIRYKAVFTTTDKYFTPILENVSINYTIDIIAPEVNSSINNTNPRYLEIINFTANLSDSSALILCQFIDNMSLDGSKRYFNISVYNQNDKCSQNYTVFAPKNSVINFTLLVNDTYGNVNRTQFILAVVNWNTTLALSIFSPIDLSIDDTIFAACNATITDNDNRSDIKNVNATFYQSIISSSAPDDNNNHYSNNSCIAVQNSTYESNYSCGFNLQYYANNGTWRCNITVVDLDDSKVFGNISATVSELIAIDVFPTVMDYGVLQPFNISNQTNITIRNIGNIALNVSVRSLTPSESLAYLNLSMVCERGNISNDNLRFSVVNGTAFSQMQPLNNESQLINFTLPQRTNDISLGNDTNATFWRLQIPAIPAGYCNGTMLFSAITLV
ncbi:hypothetical protein HYY70_07000, partial [Candidatus Woesearchaeota archaeon]|nr:hypothetical protein [Candidatus Woesearchaeota archaeon]